MFFRADIFPNHARYKLIIMTYHIKKALKIQMYSYQIDCAEYNKSNFNIHLLLNFHSVS